MVTVIPRYWYNGTVYTVYRVICTAVTPPIPAGFVDTINWKWTPYNSHSSYPPIVVLSPVY